MIRDKNAFCSALGLNDEDRLLISHIADMVKLSERSCTARFSSFLSEGEAELALRFMEYCGGVNYLLYGGYEGASRVVLGVFPDYEEPCFEAFPVKMIHFSSRYAASLSHRDYLGGIMSLGVERDQTGDIICSDEGAYAALLPAAADMAVSVIEKIGRVGVKCRFADENDHIERNDRFSEISGTVSSLRLDSVLSTAAKLSREKAAVLIRSGSVSLNHKPAGSVSEILKEGDVFSVRGYGRFILSQEGQRTKKDRIHIIIKKYL